METAHIIYEKLKGENEITNVSLRSENTEDLSELKTVVVRSNRSVCLIHYKSCAYFHSLKSSN